MPPKVSITKDLVLDAAFKIVQDNGLKGLTTRSIAKKLNCSTAPIYSSFKNIAELETEVMKKARDLLISYSMKQYSETPFLNMGVGFVLFSRENTNLYKELFLSGDRFKGILNELDVIMLKILMKDSRYNALPNDLKRILLKKMWIFTHGMSSLICVGLLNDDRDEYIIKLMSETGRAVIMDAYTQIGMHDISIWKSLCPENKGD